MLRILLYRIVFLVAYKKLDFNVNFKMIQNILIMRRVFPLWYLDEISNLVEYFLAELTRRFFSLRYSALKDSEGGKEFAELI